MALGRIKSFTKEKGFGYIDHPEHGEVLFDYEACNFEPEEGDEVEVGEVRKGYGGIIKARKVTCPAKPPS
jgi:cold shock CspA family protein